MRVVVRVFVFLCVHVRRRACVCVQVCALAPVSAYRSTSPPTSGESKESVELNRISSIRASLGITIKSHTLDAFHQGFRVAVSRVATNASAKHGPQEVHAWMATIHKVPHQPLPKAAPILEEEQMAAVGCGAAAAEPSANGGGRGAAVEQSQTEERCRQLVRRVEVMKTEHQQLKTHNQRLQARLSRQQGGAAAAAAAAGAAVGAHAGAPGHSSRAVAAGNNN
eukprot:GHVU01108595.1.p1 GENE.GHVU01108595.1~~GHVU01108595.1.p1  ORF type:complete len:223 (-),score=32.98 GHVU01108595.1:1061-1729(-)